MAYEIPVLSITLEADEDLSAAQHRFVSLSADGQAAISGVADGDIVGVNQGNEDAVGRAVEVMVYGVSKVEAGAAVAIGARVSSDATGRGITAVTGSFPQGIALEAAGGAGEIIPVLLTNTGTPLA